MADVKKNKVKKTKVKKSSYYNKRSKLKKLNSSLPKGRRVSAPSTPKGGITEGTMNLLETALARAQLVTEYYSKREELKDLLDEKGIRYADELPKEPKTITTKSVAMLDRKISRVKNKQDNKNTEYEKIVIQSYRDFINLARNAAYAEDMWSQYSDPLVEWEDRFHRYIEDNADRCDELLDEAESSQGRRSIVDNLVRNTKNIYERTEQYLYYYQYVFDWDTVGMDILFDIKDMLTQAVKGRSLTKKERMEYEEIRSSFDTTIDPYSDED